jgi:hypothetical protein
VDIGRDGIEQHGAAPFGAHRSIHGANLPFLDRTPCVMSAARNYFGQRRRLIPVDKTGMIDLEWLETELAKNRPALVGVMAANNETGVLQPWQHVAELCREKEVPFFCDAAQWLGNCPRSDWASAISSAVARINSAGQKASASSRSRRGPFTH